MADRYSDEDGVANSTEVSSSASGNIHVDLEGDLRTRPVLSANEFSGHKKKATSFQITSVTVQGNRLSNDGGDDSADDLDESHTEDISSDILDCSKTTELDNEQISSDNSNSNVEELSSASKPSIPVSTIGFGVPISIGVPSGYTEAITTMSSAVAPSVNAHEPMVTSLPDHWQHRFKIVKLANSEPFKRGRWLCMDFTDPPVIHNEQKHELTDMHGGHEAASAPCTIATENAGLPTDRSNSMAQVYEISINQSCPGGISVAVGSQQTAQPIYGFIVPVSTSAGPTVTMVQTLAMPTASTDTSKGGLVYNGQPAPVTMPVVTVPLLQSQPPVVSQSIATTQTMPQLTPLTMPLPQQQPPVLVSQPATGLPAPKPVSAPDPSSVPSHVHVPPVYIPTDSAGVGLRISSIVNPTPLLEVIPDTFGTKSQDGDDLESPAHFFATFGQNSSNSAPAGTNTVAIDNKIEQAMDLVKSHLMFAVREEVDVLKEKITELVDQISRLEQENTILKANASSETLNLLGQISAPVAVQMNQQQPQLVSSQHSVSATQQTQTTAST